MAFKMKGTQFYGKSPFKNKVWDKVKSKLKSEGITRTIASTGARGAKIARGLSGAGALVGFGRFLHKNKVGQKSVRGIRRKGNRRFMVGKI